MSTCLGFATENGNNQRMSFLLAPFDCSLKLSESFLSSYMGASGFHYYNIVTAAIEINHTEVTIGECLQMGEGVWRRGIAHLN